MSFINEERQIQDEFNRKIEGLIEVCKYLSDKGEIEQSVVNFIPWDPQVVMETKRRVIGKRDSPIKKTKNKGDYYFNKKLKGFWGY